MAKPSLCKDFLRASWWTWHFMKRGYNLGLLPGEETITDSLLIYLAHRHKGHLRIYRLKRKEESKYGADWEWWFHSPRTGTWLGMRVQAKKLNPDTLRYESLGKVGQADKLVGHTSEPLDEFIQETMECKAPMVPVYVFYNYWCREDACSKKTLRADDTWICQDINAWETSSAPGCTVAGAQRVREVLADSSPSQGVAYWELQEDMLCWEDLVCGHGHAEAQGIAEHVYQALLGRHVVAGRRGTDSNGREGNDFLLTSPPRYVKKISGGEPLREEDERAINARRVWIISADGALHHIGEPRCDPHMFRLVV